MKLLREELGLITFVIFMVLISSQSFAQVSGFTEKEVVFQNGSTELHGTLILPNIKVKAPAIVFIHGSGPMTRAGFRPYAEKYAKLGIASLFYDKRGTGASTGSWITSSLKDLAGDALAAIRYLKSEEKIDRERIGLWGISQAGWIATLAASRSKDIAFMILISGGGASPRESEMFSYGYYFKELGLSESQKSEAFKLVDQYFQYLATGEGRSKLVEQFNGLENSDKNPLYPLAKRLNQILPPEENHTNWSWVASYDPLPDMEKINCPLLLMFGDHDKDHPTEIAIKKWREGLKKAGNEKATIMVFPGAGHGIRIRDGYTGKGRAPFADGYQEVMIGWLWYHVIEGIN